MTDIPYSILLITLGWAIPLILAWIWSRIAPHLASKPPHSTSIVFSGLLAVAISLTALIVYDRQFVAKNIVVFAHEDGRCPSGYRDMSTIRIGTWKGAPERFQTAKDINLQIGTSTDGNWPYDHIKLCLRQ